MGDTADQRPAYADQVPTRRTRLFFLLDLPAGFFRNVMVFTAPFTSRACSQKPRLPFRSGPCGFQGLSVVVIPAAFSVTPFTMSAIAWSTMSGG